jgi:hypothetical protein
MLMFALLGAISGASKTTRRLRSSSGIKSPNRPSASCLPMPYFTDSSFLNQKTPVGGRCFSHIWHVFCFHSFAVMHWGIMGRSAVSIYYQQTVVGLKNL